MTDAIVARRYAHALFSLGQAGGAKVLNRYGDNLFAIGSLLESSAKLEQALKSPVISSEEKKKVLQALFKKINADPTVRNFCFLLADKERLACLGEIVACFRKLLDDAKGIIRGNLTTAVELTDAKRGQLKAALEEKAGAGIELTFDVDASILGGVVLRVGDRVLDASLRAQLAILRETFKRGE